ncbi:RNA-binding domain-containing protein [Macrolepiota fuliginosa MF-IS2]|uniref:RNA-binding domain-containing protein n=1 Tax=Macrolepiota fuliginosa MF-IS2 TaxID=1400762 RepID=A0A9P5XGX5_9AGAR|nr:RNA-binding domain-containing protein [Macrolepiota fuliginosa MF-IS2]
MGEDQLIDVFKSVGQVVGFRLVFDRETGKPRGYGFCEFADHETALSAVRNLNNVDVGGRPLRIDLADSDPFLEGKTTVRGELVDGGYPGPAEPRQRGGGGGRGHDGDFLSQVPPGVQVPKGTSVLDHISTTLAKMAPSQLMEVLAQMKAFIITHPDQARQLLVKHPQLSYALFQGLLLNNIVDPAILQRMLEQTATQQLAATGAAATPPRPPIPPAHMSQPPPFAPPAHMPYQAPAPMPGIPPPSSLPPPAAMFPPATTPYYRPPPSAGASQTPVAPVPTPAIPQQLPGAPAISESQRVMLMQVLSLTPDQINGLPENERAAIMQLRTQFGKLST